MNVCFFYSDHEKILLHLTYVSIDVLIWFGLFGFMSYQPLQVI